MHYTLVLNRFPKSEKSREPLIDIWGTVTADHRERQNVTKAALHSLPYIFRTIHRRKCAGTVHRNHKHARGHPDLIRIGCLEFSLLTPYRVVYQMIGLGPQIPMT